MPELESQQYNEATLKKIDYSLNKRKQENRVFTYDTGFTPGQDYFTKSKAAVSKSFGEGVDRIKKGASLMGNEEAFKANEEAAKKNFDSGQITKETYDTTLQKIRQSREASTTPEGSGAGVHVLGLETAYGGVSDALFGSVLSLFNPESSLGLEKIDNDPFHRTAFEKTASSIFNGVADINAKALTAAEQITADDPVKGAEYIEANKMEGVDVMFDVLTAGGFKAIGKSFKGSVKGAKEAIARPIKKLAKADIVASGSKFANSLRKATKEKKLSATQAIDALSTKVEPKQFFKMTSETLQKMKPGVSKDMFKNAAQEVIYANPRRFAPKVGDAIVEAKDGVLKELNTLTSNLKESSVESQKEMLKNIQITSGMDESAFNQAVDFVSSGKKLTKDGINVLKTKTSEFLEQGLSVIAGNADSTIHKAIKKDPLGFMDNIKLFEGLTAESVQKDLIGFMKGEKNALSDTMKRLSNTRETYSPIVQKFSELAATMPQVYDSVKEGLKTKMPASDIIGNVRKYANKFINENEQAQSYMKKAEGSMRTAREKIPGGGVKMGDVWEGTKKYMTTAKKHIAKTKQYGMDTSVYKKLSGWLDNKAAGKHFSDEKPIVKAVTDEVNEGVLNDFISKARMTGSDITDETINKTIAAVDVIKVEVNKFVANPSAKAFTSKSEDIADKQVAAVLGEEIANKLQKTSEEFDTPTVMDSLNKSMDIVDTYSAGKTIKETFGEVAEKETKKPIAKKKDKTIAESQLELREAQLSGVKKTIKASKQEDVVASFIRESGTGFRNIANQVEEIERTGKVSQPLDKVDTFIDESDFVANKKVAKEGLEKQVSILKKDIPAIENKIKALASSDGFNPLKQAKRNLESSNLEKAWFDIKKVDVDTHLDTYGKSSAISSIVSDLESFVEKKRAGWETTVKAIEQIESKSDSKFFDKKIANKQINNLYNKRAEAELKTKSNILSNFQSKVGGLDSKAMKSSQEDLTKAKKKGNFKEIKAAERSLNKELNKGMKEAKNILQKDLKSAMDKNKKNFFEEDNSFQSKLKNLVTETAGDMLLMDDAIKEVTGTIKNLNKNDSIEEAAEKFLPTYKKLKELDASGKYISKATKKELVASGINAKSFGGAVKDGKLTFNVLKKYANELSKNSNLSYKELRKGILKQLLEKTE